MKRRTITIPEVVEELVRREAEAGESFSAAVVRLIKEGARRRGRAGRPRYIASGTGAPADLGRRAEYYLRHPARSK